MMESIVVTGSFDDVRSQHVRFLEEAAGLGEVVVLLWSDKAIESIQGRPPKFPEAERRYLLEAVRYVDRVELVQPPVFVDELPQSAALKPDVWVCEESDITPSKQAFCEKTGVRLVGINDRVLKWIRLASQIYENPNRTAGQTRKKVVVTGCYDWFHSGHVRFFEEVSELGDLYVVVGNDANVEHLKGEGHPMFNEQERCYMVGAVRYVTQAFISSGWGWLDAEPEIHRIKPDIYAVNEDGHKPIKSEFCAKHGIEYKILERRPKPGLPKRQSTKLRGY